MHNYGINYGYMGLGWIFQLGILILFFLVLWWTLKNSTNFGFKAGDERPIDILKARLAKGEMSEKDYRRLKKEIER